MVCPGWIGRKAQLRVALATVTFALAGCAGASGGSPTDAATIAASPSAAASAAAETAELCPPAMQPGAAVEPGQYRASHLEPPITLTVPDGSWTIDCADETFVLWNEAGGLPVIGDVRTLLRGEESMDVDPSSDAVVAAMTELGVEFSEPQPVDVAAQEALELTVTPDETGIGFRNEHDRGWGFNSDEADTAIVTLVPAGETVLVFVRHSDDPVFAEVISSVQIED